MDIITLATTALTLATPFIEKVGEGTATKVGEDIWNLIKKSFHKKNKNIEEMIEENIQATLVEVLNEDETFKNELENFVFNAQAKIENINQSINNNGNIEKQVNIGNINGSITL
jgi:proline dehydrogenase